METSNLVCLWCPAQNPGTVQGLVVLVQFSSLLLCDKSPGHGLNSLVPAVVLLGTGEALKGGTGLALKGTWHLASC